MADVDWVVVPSIWYENAPLVIQEAFQHGKPVICSDIGGMAEAVTDGVDGLHFRAGSAGALSDTLLRAATTPGLWSRWPPASAPSARWTSTSARCRASTRRPRHPAAAAAPSPVEPPADPPEPDRALAPSVPAPRAPEELHRADR
jgi:hypothetical protein